MTERFLQMSVQAGALILASTLLRILCLNRLSKAVFPALWAAAVARLLFPFSVSARWSIYGLVHSNGATGEGITPPRSLLRRNPLSPSASLLTFLASGKQVAPCRFLRRCLKNKCCCPEMRKKLLDNRAEICYNHSRWYGIRTIGAVGSASA